MIDNEKENEPRRGNKPYAPIKNKQRNRYDERHKQSFGRQKQAARECILQRLRRVGRGVGNLTEVVFVEIPHRRVFELVGDADTRVRRYGIARIRQKLRREIIAYGGEQYTPAHNAERRPDRGHGCCSLYHILQGIRRCKE